MPWTTWAEQEYQRRERKEAEYLLSLPVCDRCGERIQDEGYFKIDGFVFCEECWVEYSKERFWKKIED